LLVSTTELTFTEEPGEPRWEKGDQPILTTWPKGTSLYEVVEVEERPIVERIYTLRLVRKVDPHPEPSGEGL
jgi:hypothetical protein